MLMEKDAPLSLEGTKRSVGNPMREIKLPRLSPGKIAAILCSMGIFAAIALLHPLGLDPRQSLLAGSFAMVVLWWITGAVDRTVASAVLLLMFCICSGLSPAQVFTFPLSETFWVFLVSFLFSAGAANSGLVEKLILPVLLRRIRSVPALLAGFVPMAVVLVFLIPQAFARIILLAEIVRQFLSRARVREAAFAPILFSASAVSVTVNMAFLRGDYALNGVIPDIAGIPLGEGEWSLYIALPTLVFALLCAGLALLVFRRELRGAFPPERAEISREALTPAERRNALAVLLTVVVWATEEFHGISGLWVVCAGTALMFPLGMLGRKDFRAINWKLLVFLSAAFSIGPVLRSTGVTDRVFAPLGALVPQVSGLFLALAVAACCMALHLVLGSNATTVSVCIAGFQACLGDRMDPLLLALTIGVAVCGHYVFPFNNAQIMVGEGRDFAARHVVRYGVPLTALALLAVACLYYPWWRFLGL